MPTLYSYPDLFGVADNNPFGLTVYAFMRLCGLDFFGPEPATVDPAIYGCVANNYYYDIDTPFKRYVLSRPSCTANRPQAEDAIQGRRGGSAADADWRIQLRSASVAKSGRLISALSRVNIQGAEYKGPSGSAHRDLGPPLLGSSCPNYPGHAIPRVDFMLTENDLPNGAA